jgi:capsular exopolysaccharide synthesis family protein
VTEPVAEVAAEPIVAFNTQGAPPLSKRIKLHLDKKIEKLVAALSPPLLEGDIAALEECRVIRSRLREILRDQKKKTVMFTSSSAEEGKTLLSVNLAFALSHLENTRVLLVDGDLRRPAVRGFLGVRSEMGLHSYLQGSSFDEVCHEVSSKLHIVPTEPVATDSAEVLHGSRMQMFLAEAAARYDVVLIDAPPLFPIVDAQVLATIVDAAVLVVRADATPYELASEAATMLKDKYIGTILNCGKRAKKHSYYGDAAYRKTLERALK